MKKLILLLLSLFTAPLLSTPRYLTPEQVHYLSEHQVPAQLKESLDLLFNNAGMNSTMDALFDEYGANKDTAIDNDDNDPAYQQAREQMINCLQQAGFMQIYQGITHCAYEHPEFPDHVFKIGFNWRSPRNRGSNAQSVVDRIIKRNIIAERCAQAIADLAGNPEKYGVSRDEQAAVLGDLQSITLPCKQAYCIPVHGQSLSEDAPVMPEQIIVVVEKIDTHKAQGRSIHEKVTALLKQWGIRDFDPVILHNILPIGQQLVLIDTGDEFPIAYPALSVQFDTMHKYVQSVWAALRGHVMIF